MKRISYRIADYRKGYIVVIGTVHKTTKRVAGMKWNGANSFYSSYSDTHHAADVFWERKDAEFVRDQEAALLRKIGQWKSEPEKSEWLSAADSAIVMTVYIPHRAGVCPYVRVLRERPA